MMEWEEHLREMAQTAVEHPGYKMLAWLTARDAVAEIDRLRAEITRLRADRQLEADIDLPAGVLALKRENEGLKAALAEKDAEIERGKTYKKAHAKECKMMFAEIGAKLQAAESLAASRLADHDSYRAAVEDALVVANIGVASGDARADLHKLLVWEIDVALDPQVSKRAADLLAEKDAEIADLRESISRAADAWIECTGYPYPACAEININKLRRELAEAQNLAASRLADQEAIERHTRRVVVWEIVDIMNNCETFQDVKAVIWQKYGVE